MSESLLSLFITSLPVTLLVTVPLVLFFPFRSASAVTTPDRWAAWFIGVATALVMTLPGMYLIGFLVSGPFDRMTRNNPAYDGTALAFVMFFLAGGLSMGCMLGTLAERSFMAAKAKAVRP